MKKFILVEKQNGGCDYTIGCGVRTSIIEAESIEDAYNYVVGKDNYGSYRINVDGEFKIESAVIYEICFEFKIDTKALRNERAKDQEKDTLELKRKQLEQLKKELGE